MPDVVATPLHDADAAGKARRNWLETVDALRDPLMVHDAAGRVVRANRAYAEHAGLQHHDRLDGSGYPSGAKGGEMALEARILAVADVVEAMASHRPYRPGLGVEAALKEIEAKRGRWFEPAAVDACLKLFRERGFRFEGP